MFTYTKVPKKMSNMGMRRVARKVAAGKPLGADASDTYVWTTDRPTIATVAANSTDSSKAVVSGKIQGSATLSVTDGVATATAPINVSAAAG